MVEGGSNVVHGSRSQTDKDACLKADALSWSLLDPSLHPIYNNYTDYYDLWTQAKTLYTNDIQHMYSAESSLINLRQEV